MKKIAILGTTPSRGEAPINDESWEIWTIGPGGKDSHRWDRLFELHRVWPEDFKNYLNDLSQVKKPQIVHTLEPMPLMMEKWAGSLGKDADWLAETIKGKWTSNKPLDWRKMYEKHRGMWFSSSISYCIAHALDEGVEHLGLWGIDLESGEEYISQFAGCRHFLDIALDRGIKVTMPDGCGLDRDITPYPERYETNLALTFEKKIKFLEAILAGREPEYENCRLEVYRSEGRLLSLQEIRGLPYATSQEFQQWVDETVPKVEQHLIQHNNQLNTLWATVNHLKGEKEATKYYQRMFVHGMNDPNDTA